MREIVRNLILVIVALILVSAVGALFIGFDGLFALSEADRTQPHTIMPALIAVRKLVSFAYGCIVLIVALNLYAYWKGK